MAPFKQAVTDQFLKVWHSTPSRRLRGHSTRICHPVQTRQPIEDSSTEDQSVVRRSSQRSRLSDRGSPNRTGTNPVVASPAAERFTENPSTAAQARPTAPGTGLGAHAQSTEYDEPHGQHQSLEDQSDAIMPETAPQPSESSPQPTATKPPKCTKCRGWLDEEAQFGKRTLYLPCCHAFHKNCLQSYIGEQVGVGHCPEPLCNRTMRHKCQHQTMPTTTRPPPTNPDPVASALPTDYEFCLTDEGKKYFRSVDRRVTRARRVETRKMSWINIYNKANLKVSSYLAERMEERWDKAHDDWWNNRWNQL